MKYNADAINKIIEINSIIPADHSNSLRKCIDCYDIERFGEDLLFSMWTLSGLKKFIDFLNDYYFIDIWSLDDLKEKDRIEKLNASSLMAESGSGSLLLIGSFNEHLAFLDIECCALFLIPFVLSDEFFKMLTPLNKTLLDFPYNNEKYLNKISSFFIDEYELDILVLHKNSELK